MAELFRKNIASQNNSLQLSALVSAEWSAKQLAERRALSDPQHPTEQLSKR